MRTDKGGGKVQTWLFRGPTLRFFPFTPFESVGSRQPFAIVTHLTQPRPRAIIAAMVEEPIAFLRAETGSQPARNGSNGGPVEQVRFDRAELNRILSLYGRMVTAGEWRDYAIDFLRERAVFSVFRRASEVPIYRIEKDPRLARKQGMYSVISATGLILRRGHELDRVLLAIDRKLAVV